MSEVLKLLNHHLHAKKHTIPAWLTIENFSIGLMWLFTLSALIGISLGYFNWFAPKTPINLMLCFLLVLINIPFGTTKGAAMFTIAFAVGMGIEIAGVSTGMIFGQYSYGDNLGFKAWGVPLMIGIYWAVLITVTSQMSRSIFSNIIPAVIFASLLMIGLDFLMEHLAAIFDFWYFEGGIAGPQNYLSWFIVSLALHFLAYYWMPKTSAKFSTHLYFNQFIFFTVAYILLVVI